MIDSADIHHGLSQEEIYTGLRSYTACENEERVMISIALPPSSQSYVLQA
jgi:hypothetical protein